MKLLTFFLIAAIWLGGCAFVNIKTPDLELTSCTLLKDIRLDPNGVASTTSSSAESIVASVAAFFVGFFTR